MSLSLLFKNRQFTPLYWIQFFGALNDNFLKNGMVILIEYQGLGLLGLDPPAIVALAGAIFILPFFLFSMMAGQFADRYEKSRIIRYVKLWEVAITLTASLGFYAHNLYVLLLALFMMGCHSTFFGPIKYSALPDIVPPKQLVTANAYVEVGTFLAILLGTIGGGVLIARPEGELWLSLTVIAMALIGLAISWRMPKIPSHSPNLKLRWKPLSLMIENFKMLRRKSSVYHSILGISWFWAFGAAILSLLPPYCKEFLHTNEHVVTAFLAMFTVGIGVGSILCERLSRGKLDLGLVPIGAIGMTIFLFDLARLRPPLLFTGAPLLNLEQFTQMQQGWHMLFDFTAMSIFGGFYALPLYTALQVRSQKRTRSRVIAGNNVLNSIFMVFGAVYVMAFHLLHIPLPDTFLVLALLNLLAATYIVTVAPEFRLRLLASLTRRRR